MRLAEFVEAAESYGVTVPEHWHTGGRGRDGIRDFLGFDIQHVSGGGAHREYTERHIRRLVAWLRFRDVTGVALNHDTAQRRQAMRLLAAAPEGWVVMADGRAWWSLVPPVGTLRSRCAVAIPVPDWRH